MSVSDLGRAIVDANKRHGGSPLNAVQSAGEFALLCALLGDNQGTIKIEHIRQLFAENKFPDGALTNLGNRTAQQWLELTLGIIGAISQTASSIHHRAEEMKVEQLKEHFKAFFGPLLARL